MIDSIVRAGNKVANVLWAIWSAVINAALWIGPYRGKWGTTSTLLAQIKARTKTIADIRRELKAFDWTQDSFLDWQPWTHTIIQESFKDDCDGAAVYGKYLLSCLGIESRRVKLLDPCGTWKPWKWTAHIVQIAESNHWMVSNGELVEIVIGLDTEHFEKDTVIYNWREFVNLYFARSGDDYKYILD